MTSAGERGSADQHLGESLAALIDGELCHDSRDRVLAHLATCQDCRTEAAAQRRLKSVFAESALPPPSDRLLARLQDLPAADEPRALSSGPSRPPALGGGFARWGGGLPGGSTKYESLLTPPALGSERGFRIHDPHPARGQRSHRFAFAAAGAFSLAAFAISGALTTSGAGGQVPASVSPPSTVTAGGGATSPGPGASAAGRIDQYTEWEMVRNHRLVPADQSGATYIVDVGFGPELPVALAQQPALSRIYPLLDNPAPVPMSHGRGPEKGNGADTAAERRPDDSARRQPADEGSAGKSPGASPQGRGGRDIVRAVSPR